MSFVRVKQPFYCAGRVYVVGTVLAADDPVVAPRPELFDRLEDVAEPVVEQATAAPGERRTRTRKAPAAKAVAEPVAEIPEV